MRIEFIFLIIASVTLVVSIGLLLLTGITHTGKNKALVIEKMHEFYEVTKPGYVYRHPFMYHIVGRYTIREEKAINKIGDYSVSFNYQIEDVRKYHYSGHCFLLIIEEKVEKLKEITPEIIKETILSSAEESGIEVISMDIYLTSDNSN